MIEPRVAGAAELDVRREFQEHRDHVQKVLGRDDGFESQGMQRDDADGGQSNSVRRRAGFGVLGAQQGRQQAPFGHTHDLVRVRGHLGNEKTDIGQSGSYNNPPREPPPRKFPRDVDVGAVAIVGVRAVGGTSSGEHRQQRRGRDENDRSEHRAAPLGTINLAGPRGSRVVVIDVPEDIIYKRPDSHGAVAVGAPSQPTRRRDARQSG
mmetsp:Transcript_12861/g.51570  ORF Transcript_12861/g.51570 Transcript_12861/m.51570 type:complete len:208 (-) Transcript_12861:802-1425(-)